MMNDSMRKPFLLPAMLPRAWWLIALLLAVVPAAGGQTLKKSDSFDLPGPPGKRFDCLTMH